MAEDDSEKTHDPSEKKKRDAAEKGQIARSQDLGSAAALITAGLVLAYGSGPTGRAMARLLERSMQFEHIPSLDAGDVAAWTGLGMRTMLEALAIPLGAVAVVGFAINAAQTQGQLATKALEPKPERLDIIKGFQEKYLSPQPLMEGAKGVLKLGALGALTFWGMKDEVRKLPALSTLDPAHTLEMVITLGSDMVLNAIPLLLTLAAIDYGYNWWRNNEKLKMSTKELKDERKEAEGDPMVKAQRRRRAREIAMRRDLQRVPEADVIITNPTHYAVAIRYRKDEADAPVILAMGVDHWALRIRSVARENDVPQVENRPLARALYAQGTIGQLIPEELFQPVAKVLAVIYRRRSRRRIN